MPQQINDIRDRLIVALDVPTIWDAYRIVSTLGDGASFYKIGYRLAFAGGLDLARQLVTEGKKVFLDLKLHDIGNTVTEGVEFADQARRHLPHRPCLSADHARRGRGAGGKRPQAARRDGADLLRRRRPARRRLWPRRARPRAPARRAGPQRRHRRHRLRGRRDRDRARRHRAATWSSSRRASALPAARPATRSAR